MSTDTVSRYIYFPNTYITNRVVRWGTVKQSTDRVFEGNFNVTVANADQALNTIQTSPIGYFTKTCSVNLVQSGNVLAVYKGDLIDANYNQDGTINLGFQGFHEYSKKRIIGTNSVPIKFMGAMYNPACIWWAAVTCGTNISVALSSVASTSNPNIDFASWQQWQTGADIIQTQMQANLNGVSLADFCQKLTNRTNVVIQEDRNGKIRFSLTQPNSATFVTVSDASILQFDDTKQLNFDVDYSMKEMLNRYSVNVQAWDTAGDVNSWNDVITLQNDSSVNSYGKFESTESVGNKDIVWHSSSLSAIYYVHYMKLKRFAFPLRRLKFDTLFWANSLSINDVCLVSNSFYQISNKFNRVHALSFDMDRLKYNVVLEDDVATEEGLGWFVLDHSSYGLLDQSNNPLF